MSKIKFEIKNRWTGSILFEYEKENNTLKDTVEKAVKEEADLTGADLTGADLTGADLREANLTGADLREADLRGANLTGADLRRANLTGTNLRRVNLTGADLRRANLTGADLREADLTGTNLTGTNLRRVNLTGADLREADLTGTNLTGTYIYLSDEEMNIKEKIANFEEKNNIKIIEYYINKNIIPTRWNAFWRYGLIICNYEVIEKEAKKMTVSEICKELGYDIEIVKE